ncbi:protein hunchback [Cloeon dipterum]|uniref:protein hunchback n=1 Tax=Cloeon dipterum TaxID=197152 RepID=UPI00321F730E
MEQLQSIGVYFENLKKHIHRKNNDENEELEQHYEEQDLIPSTYLKMSRGISYRARVSAVPQAHLRASQEQDNTREQQPAMYDDSGVAMEQSTGGSSFSSSLQGTPPGLSNAAAASRATTCSTPVEQESMETEETPEPERPSSTGNRSPSPEIYKPHLRCPICGVTNFDGILKLFLHFTDDHSNDKINAPHLNCSVCTLACLSKESLTIHTVTHMAQGGRCLLCPFKSDNNEKMDKHRVSFHHLPSTLNKKGKSKKQKCKAKGCTFEATDKYTMWLHFRGHVLEGKYLTCLYCPFATSFKHHLEYHHDSHLGRKREHCPHCDYKCVNKAMLKSHLKRHSDWCDYKCADCKFEAKYHHILKTHLQAKNHNQMMVVRPDGTQVPTVDVNGRRRGPRSKAGAPAVPYQFPLPPVPVNNVQMMPAAQLQPVCRMCRLCGSSITSEQQMQEHMATYHSNPQVVGQLMHMMVLDQLQAALVQQGQLRLAAARHEQDLAAPINLSMKPATPPVAVPEQAASSGEEDHMDIGRLAINENPIQTRVVRKYCEHCDLDFKNSQEYANHIGHHGTPDPFSCRMCGFKANNKESFYFHINTINHD